MLGAGVRFVAHWVVLSVGLLPFAFVVAALDVGYPWLAGGVTVGLAAVAVDRGVALETTGTLSLVAVASFFVVQAAAGGALGDPSTAWTVGAAGTAYALAVLVDRTNPRRALRAAVDPGRRGRRDD